MVNLIKKERKGESSREEADKSKACAGAEILIVAGRRCRRCSQICCRQGWQELVFYNWWGVDWDRDSNGEQRGPEEEVVYVLGGQLLPHGYRGHLPDHPLHHVHRHQWSQPMRLNMWSYRGIHQILESYR